MSEIKNKIIINKKSVLMVLIGLLFTVIYVYLFWNYIGGYICTRAGSFLVASVIFIIISALFIIRIKRANPILLVKKENIYIKAVIRIAFFLFTLSAGFFLEELLWNNAVRELTAKVICLNLFLECLIYLSLLLLLRNIRFASILYISANWLFGSVSYYVLMFRGIPIKFSDLLVAATALTVAGSYTYVLSDSMLLGTFFLLIYLCALTWFKIPGHRNENTTPPKKNSHFILAFICLIMLWIAFIKFDYIKTFKIETNWWDPIEYYTQNGGLVSMLVSIDQVQMKKPAGYSEANAIKSLKNAGTDSNSSILPNIIVIMNESFSDLSVLGEFESDEYLEHWNSISDYVQKGYIYTSTYGAGTCNSEFEFLTGASMGLCGGRTSYPYSTYDLSNSWNIAEELNKLGYNTVAFHPYDPTNWNRDSVYKNFGFDTFYSEADMDGIDFEYVSWAVSDSTDYQKVYEIFEESQKPLFLFNVTMQNHGGYTGPIRSDLELVNIEDDYDQYSDAINFLTLMRESDSAFYDLLQYFKNVDEPTIICLFGDHQPNLDDSFVNSVLRKDPEKRVTGREIFMTPYIIYSNFDTGLESRTLDTSLNYLGAMVLDIAGINDQPYVDYLLELQKEIPAIYCYEYEDNEGHWHLFDEENSYIEDYKSVQYYELSAGQ